MYRIIKSKIFQIICQNVTNDNIYFAGTINIFNALKIDLHEVLELTRIIILRIFFCNWKTLLMPVELLQNIMPYFIIKWKSA
jgi:hypothetical protein